MIAWHTGRSPNGTSSISAAGDGFVLKDFEGEYNVTKRITGYSGMSTV